MSGDSRDYYHSSSPTGGSRRTNRTHHDRDHSGRYDQHLPSIRDVVGDQLNAPVPHRPAYNPPAMDAPEVYRQNSYSSQPGPRLPPIARHESSQQSRQSGHEHHGRHHTGSDGHYHRGVTAGHSPAPPAQPSHQDASRGSFYVFAQSDARGELVKVSSASTPQGIVRDRVPVGHHQPSSEDTKKKYECHVCGWRMERQSVYTQHMITHTNERPHVCAICRKSFNSKSNLNRHVQTHGSRSFQKEDTEGSGGGPSSSRDYYNSSRKM